MSGDWINFAEFADMQRPELQRQADERDARFASQQRDIDAALAGLSGAAFGAARQGAFRGLDRTDGYAALMNQRDAALQQSQRQQVAPWESDLGGPAQQESPWAKLGGRLAGLNQRAAERSTFEQNEQRRKEQVRQQQEFQRQQAAKLDEAMNGQRRRDGEAYAKWSDAVQGRGSMYGGSGQSAYTEARYGGAQAPRATQSSATTNMQKKLGDIEDDQLMRPSSSSNFGYSTSGF